MRADILEAFKPTAEQGTARHAVEYRFAIALIKIGDRLPDGPERDAACEALLSERTAALAAVE